MVMHSGVRIMLGVQRVLLGGPVAAKGPSGEPHRALKSRRLRALNIDDVSVESALGSARQVVAGTKNGKVETGTGRVIGMTFKWRSITRYHCARYVPCLVF